MSASTDQDRSTVSKTKPTDSSHVNDEKDVSTKEQLSKEQLDEQRVESEEQKSLQWRKEDDEATEIQFTLRPNVSDSTSVSNVNVRPNVTDDLPVAPAVAMPTVTNITDEAGAENQDNDIELKADAKLRSEAGESVTQLEGQSVSERDSKIQHPDDFAKPALIPFKLPSRLPRTGKRTTPTLGLKQNEETKTKELGAESSQEHVTGSEASTTTSEKVEDKDNIPDSGDTGEADESSSKQAMREKEKTRSTSSNVNYQTRKKPRPQFEPSPAEKLSIPPLPYKEPSWGGTPVKKYSLDVLKGGRILETITLNDRSFHLFGRLDVCDVILEHPSISRYHLVLQYRKVGDSEQDPGYYLYDLGSTHGSTFNKSSMKPRVYYRIKVGHHFKLGGSKRSFILQGPSEDEEAESELSVSELKELRRKQLAEQEEMKKKQEDERMEIEEVTEEDDGISWGLRDDADEEIDMDKNPFNVMSQAEKEATYVKDPKKTLRGYFEREGVELEYNVEEKGSGFNKQYVCKVELPIDNAEGEPIIAEAAVSGKKKEAVAACAMEACRILDAHGVLRQAVHESKQKKKKNWAEDDYYDSDDDSYLDRTGMIEKKRTQRMMKAGVIKQEVDTYDTLVQKLDNVNKELEETQTELNVLNQEKNTGSEEDTLDAFINQLKSGKMVDKTKRAKMKLRAIELRKEQAKLQRLIRLVQPASVSVGSTKPQSKFAALSQRLPMTGVMKGRKPSLVKHKTQTKPEASSSFVSSTTHESKMRKDEGNKVEEVEEEEEEEEEDKGEETAVTTTMTSSTSQEIVMQDSQTKTMDAIADKIGEVSGETIHDKVKNETEERVQEQKKEERVQSPEKQHKYPSNQQKRPKRVFGPQMGPLIKFKQFLDRDEPEENTSEGPDAKKKKDDDFADWIPPDDQKGDGRTFLNEKYGY